MFENAGLKISTRHSTLRVRIQRLFLRRLFAVSESCYLLNDLFLFGFGAIEKDRFSAFEYRFGRGSRNWVPTYRNQGLYVGSRGGSGCPPIPIT